MKFDAILNTPPAWLSEMNDPDGIVIGSIVRMVRNLPGFPFPGWSTSESRAAVADSLIPAIKGIRGFKSAFCAEMNTLSYGQRRALLTRKFLTPCMAARQDGCHIIIPQRKNMILMVNEEEHLVMHAFHDGFDVDKCVQSLHQFESQLSEQISFAYTTQNGYLTSIPSEAGDGLQLYILLHLPALSFANMMGQVTKALEKLHVNISPYFSDGQDDTGNLFILFSIPGPEDSLDEISDNFTEVIDHLVNRERQVRRRLLHDKDLNIHDAIGRFYGVLTHCRRLSTKDMRDGFSMLRLGTLLGIIQWESSVTDMINAMQCFLLQQTTRTALAEEEDSVKLSIERATAVRDFINNNPHKLSYTTV